MTPRPDDHVLVDTNVLLSASDSGRPTHAAAVEVLQGWPAQGITLYTCGQILREYLVVATRPVRVNGLGLAAADALANADTLADRLRFLEETRLAYVRCRQLVEETGSGGKQIHDANIAATGLTYGIDAVVTFNTSDFERFPELRVLSPEYGPRET